MLHSLPVFEEDFRGVPQGAYPCYWSVANYAGHISMIWVVLMGQLGLSGLQDHDFARM